MTMKTPIINTKTTGDVFVKIVIIGAGHGGLQAAKELSKDGFDVTVYEKNSPEKVSYDWRDDVEPTALGIKTRDFFFALDNISVTEVDICADGKAVLRCVNG